MKCKTIHKNLIFFLEGDLPVKKMEQIKVHLSECEECALFAEDMKKTLGIFEEEKSIVSNPFFYTRLKIRLESQSESGNIPFWKPILTKVIQPAFFSILLIAGIYAGFKAGKPSPLQNSVYAMQNQEILFLNEMKGETIERFLME